MKRKNKKLLTLMLAGALCTATIGATLAVAPSLSASAAEKYALTDVFATTNATIGSEEVGEKTLTAFTYAYVKKATTESSDTRKDGVKIKRNLALKWYEEKGAAKYLSVEFSFKDLNFSNVSFTVESASAWATEEEKASNVVTFTNESGVVSVSVNGEKADSVDTITAGQTLTLSLTDGEGYADGEFGVTLKVADGEAKKIGTFTNVGANYAQYTADKMYPLTVMAEVPQAAEGEAEIKSVVYLTNINGQKFDNITKDASKDVVTDTAAPVLVVNEKVGGFLLGTQFALEYEKVDVLQNSSLTDSKEYYQYNPSNEDTKYKTLTTSTYFMDSVYYVKDGAVVTAGTEGAEATSVYAEEGKEYVSVKITLGDKTFNAADGEYAKKTYELSWYADEDAVESKKLSGEDAVAVDYIVVDRNQEGATYTGIVADEESKTNKVIDQTAMDEQVKVFETLLAEAAKDIYAGSNSYVYIPSVKWLIGDNNGYRNLKFTISYRSSSSDSAKTASSLSYSGLRFAVADEGKYEFKIFANDKAGNTMKYYLDGELVSVTTSNVWNIEEIPSFKFEIANKGLKMDNEDLASSSDRKDSEVLDKTYTFSDIKVVGATNLQQNYSLYRIDMQKANAIQLTESVLASITYKEIRLALVSGETNKIAQVTDGNYLGLYFETYVQLLANKLGESVTADKVKECFIEIKEFDDRINEEEHAEEWAKNNKYNWSVASQSFKTVEEGNYVLLADYWEAEIPVQRAAAYKVLTVESKDDVIEGDNNWLEDNLVSVILFGVAGVLAIVIIILLLIKPSDETLEDVDKKAEKKQKSKEDKE